MIFACVIVAVVAVSVAVGVLMNRGGSSKVDEAAAASLAECLSNSGAKMYGALWCPHCQKQKKMFGAASGKVPYIECSDEKAPNGQAKVCADAGIVGYPTWVFANGQRADGELTLKDLADKSGCPFGINAAVAPAAAVVPVAPVVIPPAPVPTPAAPSPTPTEPPPAPANSGY